MLNGNLHYLQVDLHLFVDLWMQHFMLSCNYSLYIIHTILICFARMDFSEQCHIKDTKIKGKLYKSLKNLYIDQLANKF